MASPTHPASEGQQQPALSQKPTHHLSHDVGGHDDNWHTHVRVATGEGVSVEPDRLAMVSLTTGCASLQTYPSAEDLRAIAAGLLAAADALEGTILLLKAADAAEAAAAQPTVKEA